MDTHLAGAIRRLVAAGLPALGAGLAVLWAIGGFGDGWPVASRIGGVLGAALVGAVCVVVYLAVLAALRAPEITMVTALVRSRIRR